MPGPTWRKPDDSRCARSPRATLDAKWKSRPWHHRPSGASGEPHPRNDLNLRLRRVLSWLGRAEKDYKAGDCDAAFIFYWIAFNAMYGQLGTSSVDDIYERDRRRDYFDRSSPPQARSLLDSRLRRRGERHLRHDLVSSSGRHRENAGKPVCLAARARKPRRNGLSRTGGITTTRRRIETGSSGSTAHENGRRMRSGEHERKTCSVSCFSASTRCAINCSMAARPGTVR